MRPYLEAKSFLVIRRDNIGDMVCTTPLFAALRAHFPDARICALANTYNSVVLDRNPFIDHVYALPADGDPQAGAGVWQRFGRNLSDLFKLHEAGFECVIQASRSTPRRHKIFGRLLGARHYLTRARDPDVGHEVIRTLSVLNQAGIYSDVAPPQIFPSPDGVARVRALLGDAAADHAPTAVHLSARSLENRWPREHYRELIRRAAQSGERVVVLWSPGNRERSGHPGDDETAKWLGEELASLHVTFFRTETVADLISVLAVCSNLIACDGGHCHLAAALQVPVLGLYCDAKVLEWRPWGDRHRIVSSATVPKISVEAVWREFLMLPRPASREAVG